MSKFQVHFKDPDLIYEIVRARHPFPEDEEDITPRMERERDEFSAMYFEYGDYGRFEVDAKTLECRLIPRKEWKD